ncbi:hypothetical protein [Paenibacillus thermotolerans]|uniref:hypothetical protein n=1 Tax=Paenibacillus thermotolerans TaxID=3027807 RepID=UPI0023682041|nr:MULTISPECIES: hypothetical protein [unclassified Paenibacillus]
MSKGPESKKDKKNVENKPLTMAEIYGRLSRRPLQKEWYDHNHYEIVAIFEDLGEEMKEQVKLHGGEVEEPQKLTRKGIADIMAHFNGK